MTAPRRFNFHEHNWLLLNNIPRTCTIESVMVLLHLNNRTYLNAEKRNSPPPLSLAPPPNLSPLASPPHQFMNHISALNLISVKCLKLCDDSIICFVNIGYGLCEIWIHIQLHQLDWKTTVMPFSTKKQQHQELYNVNHKHPPAVFFQQVHPSIGYISWPTTFSKKAFSNTLTTLKSCLHYQ